MDFEGLFFKLKTGHGKLGFIQHFFFMGIFLILYVTVMKNLIANGLPVIKSEPRRRNGDSLVINQVDSECPLNTIGCIV